MNSGRVLLDILILLVAAKAAAEVAERVNLPAVLGEIVAGIAIGPSALGWVHPNEVLHVLAELGVILLLVQVGMETDIRELGRVGRTSLAVAVVGVVLPFALGWGTSSALGHGGMQAVFIGAALTATSVGITARVFGDLRALAMTESRIVLGAAVADDVFGLIILTVVARAATDGSVDVNGLLILIGGAIAFLAAAGAASVIGAPRVFAAIHRRARSSGTLLALALAFALGIAELATLAKLAPIIGAFLAGIALGRSAQGERIGHELAPLGHIFVPVFFLSIGLEADLAALAKPSVIALALALTAVGVIGKVVAGWAARESSLDRLLIGLGMIPRGEVGLIFASIGRATGVLDGDLYAAIILVVLLTTIATPPLLRWRVERVRRSARTAITGSPPVVPPSGGWLTLEGDVDLVAIPPATLMLSVALEAATHLDTRPPGTELLAWLARHNDERVEWSRTDRELLWSVLRNRDPRAWRFLEATGVLAAALPELSDALDRRRHDPTQLDALGALRWPVTERLVAEDAELDRLVHPERVLVAALAFDVSGDTDPARAAQALSARLGLDHADEIGVARLIADRSLLLGTTDVVAVASHLADRDELAELRVLTSRARERSAERRTPGGASGTADRR